MADKNLVRVVADTGVGLLSLTGGALYTTASYIGLNEIFSSLECKIGQNLTDATIYGLTGGLALLTLFGTVLAVKATDHYYKTK